MSWLADRTIICFCEKCGLGRYYRIDVEDIYKVFDRNTLKIIHYEGPLFQCCAAATYGVQVEKPKLPTRGLTYSQRQWENYLFEKHMGHTTNRLRRIALRVFKILLKATQDFRSAPCLFSPLNQKSLSKTSLR